MKNILKKIIPEHAKQLLKFLWMEMRSYCHWFLDLFISVFPSSYFFNRMKKLLLVVRGAKIGRHPYIYPRVWIDLPYNLKMGDDVVLSRGVLITTWGRVNIGNRVLIGYDSKILSANHVIPDNVNIPIITSGHELKEITIEDDVWIGANVVITAGVKVGRGSVIAAGAVVTKDVEPYTIVGGVPARLIKRRISDKSLDEENS